MTPLTDKTLELVLNMPLDEKRTLYRYLSTFMTMRPEKMDYLAADTIKKAVIGITGYDVTVFTRKRDDVTARAMIIYQLYLEGYRQSDIAKFVGVDRASVCYTIKKWEDVICYPQYHKQESRLWKELQTKLIELRNGSRENNTCGSNE